MTEYLSHVSLLGQLDMAARIEKDELMKFNLNLCKDELWDAFRRFEQAPTGDNLIELNGKWAHGVRMLVFAGSRNDDDDRPGTGLKEAARLAA